MNFHGQTALITGASTGMGAAFARELAARGADLVLVARSRDKLQALADQLTDAHGVRVDVVPTDLAQPGAGAALARHVTAATSPSATRGRSEQTGGLGRTVDVLINNAGFATYGDVAQANPVRLHEQVQLNVTALLDLTTALLPAMTARGTGSIINVASLVAFQPMPHMAVYGATKAFVLSFTEALWAETKPTGVHVLAVCPGPTDTPFYEVLDAQEASAGTRRSPEQVVATALRALEKGVPSVIDGRNNRLVARLPRLLPRRAVLNVAERSVRPRTSH